MKGASYNWRPLKIEEIHLFIQQCRDPLFSILKLIIELIIYINQQRSPSNTIELIIYINQQRSPSNTIELIIYINQQRSPSNTTAVFNLCCFWPAISYVNKHGACGDWDIGLCLHIQVNNIYILVKLTAWRGSLGWLKHAADSWPTAMRVKILLCVSWPCLSIYCRKQR
jgi:hypothetical protein